jgi:hypothetical protein
MAGENAVEVPANKGKQPNWLVVIIVGEVVRTLGSYVLGIVTTFLVLLKAGLLQLLHWPGDAFILLAVVEVVLFVLVFAGSIIYMLHWGVWGISYMFSRLAKTTAPKRAGWLTPIDWLAMLMLLAMNAVLDWRRRQHDEPMSEAEALWHGTVAPSPRERM